MDLIGTLASTLGVESSTAQALAGTVLGKVQEEVADNAGADAASQVADAVPELSGWQEKAAALAGGGGGGGLLGALGGGGGLLGAAAEAIGGEDARQTATLVALAAKFDIDPTKAALAAPLVLDFLKERLDPGMFDTVMKAAPLLAGTSGGDAGGGLGAAASALGGLFGKD